MNDERLIIEGSTGLVCAYKSQVVGVRLDSWDYERSGAACTSYAVIISYATGVKCNVTQVGHKELPEGGLSAIDVFRSVCKWATIGKPGEGLHLIARHLNTSEVM